MRGSPATPRCALLWAADGETCALCRCCAWTHGAMAPLPYPALSNPCDKTGFDGPWDDDSDLDPFVDNPTQLLGTEIIFNIKINHVMMDVDVSVCPPPLRPRLPTAWLPTKRSRASPKPKPKPPSPFTGLGGGDCWGHVGLGRTPQKARAPVVCGAPARAGLRSTVPQCPLPYPMRARVLTCVGLRGRGADLSRFVHV